MRVISLAEVARLFGCLGSFPSLSVHGYSTDSRQIKTGELFFALNGERVDGHSYLRQVQKKGAIGAVVSKNFREDISGFPLLRVDDPLYSLQKLAKHALAKHPTRVVAITGSLGKTTTKEFTKALLSTKYRVSASPGNHNSQVGLPLAILNHTTGKEDICVLEMGMTLPGQIQKLIEIAPPDVAVITTTALVHACNFNSIEDIGYSKGEIFLHPKTRVGILCRDIANFAAISALGNCKKISFSTNSPNADYYCNPSEPYHLHSLQEQVNCTLQTSALPGKHNLHNLLAAITIARCYNIEWSEIINAIPSIALPDLRLQFIRHRDIIFLNDSYNAAEVSVKAALEALPQPPPEGRKIAVLGSMLELGRFSVDCHRRVGAFALNHVEHMYCLGEECLPICEEWKKAGRPVHFFYHRAELVACLRNQLKAKDVVLLKGSRSKELWKVIEEL